MSKQYRPIAIWAFLLALPLILAGIAAARLLEADHVVTREHARIDADRNAGRLANAAADALTGASRPLIDRLAGADDVVLAARTLLYTNQASAVVVRHEGRRLFPPDSGLDLTPGMAAQVKLLEAETDGDAAAPIGWFAGAPGPTFFQCVLDHSTRQICVALDWSHIQRTILSGLDSAAAPLSGWSFRLRDPFDRVLWSTATPRTTADTIDLDGAMRGWRLAAASPEGGGFGIRGDLALAIPIALAWALLVWSKVRRERERLSASAARADLVAKLSHDLRTPLANLKLYAELIARHATTGATGHNKIVDYCGVLTKEIDRLDALAGHTISYGAATPIRLDEAAPDETVRTIITRLSKLLEASGCRCEVDGGAEKFCRFDRAGFERILINLLDNARKYAPGAIRVTTTLDDERLRLSVRDWGVGTMPRTLEGSGLGLAVVRDLARANGGRADIVPCVPGTRVDVTIRVAPVNAAMSV